MTLVNMATGELAESITEADVDASIERVRRHAESIWDEWAWQVENKTWLVKGFDSWDEMRREVYGGLTNVTAPRAERPELISRFRTAGLTQTETATTLGVSRPTVARHDEPTYQPRESNVSNDTFTAGEEVVDAEIVEDEPAPKPERDSGMPSRELTLINDIRLYLGQLASAPEIRKLTTVGQQHIIDALRNAATQIERYTS